MLLELEKIKEVSIPHLYVFPTGSLEFTCAMFKGSGYTTFKIVKYKIYEKWKVLLDEECNKEPSAIPSACDAYTTLQEIVKVLRSYSNAKIFEKPKGVFPFISKGPIDRKRNISALLLFIENKCLKKNSNGQKSAIQLKEEVQ
ncbi:hypothetical protein EROM_061160 [Encephalitozoon romaleae SJ-2008]|uniref:Uncharacterized protein n=1 Tax=Encephalitozoon romaleae (strain SJ-2008) TaxID=1178016 RepID=I6ZJ21_ENCRO|nr:hypothetical protein EROM_061160 [Encephalitozoon romaleae SJ-2008]AFN83208.1 hypothetical protein EROM_061160 [Encephalitozoon romaleae SJ-2008]